MSHFTVLVIGDNPEDQLQPYHEFECTGEDDQYVIDIDNTEEMLEEWGDGNHSNEDGTPQTFEQWAEDEGRKCVPFGEKPDLAEKHKYSYVLLDADGKPTKAVRRTNENAKWDWYQLGGRWTGFLLLKPGTTGELGKRGVFDTPPEIGFADQTLYKNVDWEGMRNKAEEMYMPKFDKVVEIVAGRRVPEFKDSQAKFPDDIDKARKDYWADPVIKDLKAADAMPFMGSIQEEYAGLDRAKYRAKIRQGAVMTFAVVKDSKWYERGNMGWWACVSNEKERDTWEREYASLLESLDPDTLLSVYDCHI